MKRSYDLEDPSDGVRIIFNLILNCVLECVLLLCGLKLGPVGGCCQHGIEYSGSITWGIFD